MAPVRAEKPASGTDTIRKLWPSDVAAYRAHLLRLDPEARYSRFGTVMTDDVTAEHANACFGADTLVFGCFIAGKIRGAAELHLLTGASGLRNGTAEAAFSVEQRWRHDGVGSALVERLILAAQSRAVRSLVITCLPQNVAMQNLAKKYGARLKCDTDEVTGKIKVELPTPQTLLTELFEESLDFASALFDLQRRILPPVAPVAILARRKHCELGSFYM